MRRFWTLVCLLMSGCSACGEVHDGAIGLGQQTELVVDGSGAFWLQDASGRRVEPRSGCAPFSVALRPDGSDPRRFHNPDNPPDDLVWMHLVEATAAGDGQWSLRLVSDDGVESATGTLRAAAGAEGFVDADFAVDVADARVALIASCWPLSEGAHAVGGGEIFEGVDLRGRVVPLFFQAPARTASGLNEKHAPVPFVTTTDGLALWVETERVGAVDVGASDAGALRFRFQGNRLPLRLRVGDPVDHMAAHARRAGLPPMPPTWALTPQLWRNEHAVTMDGGDVVRSGRDRLLDDAQRLRALDIPGSVLWIDAPWSTGHNTFTFNELQFPEPEEMLQRIEALGFRSIVWATEQINSSDDSDQMVGMPPRGSEELFNTWRDRDWLVSTRQGNPFQFLWGRGFGGFPDFTKPEAFAGYGDLARPLIRMGVRGFKLDFCETMRADLLGFAHNDAPIFADGSTTEVQHTRYARLFHEAMIRVLQQEHPEDWFVITRTGGIYDQPNGTTLWPGDLDNDFRVGGESEGYDEHQVGGLPAAISAALSAASSGYPLFGSDIGGYRGGTPTTEVLLRWAQFGALSTIMQLGGGGTGDATHNPWDERYETEIAIPIYRTYAQLHMRLVPTIEAALLEATTVGKPPMLPVGLLANTEAAWADINTFVFAGRLLAAPVVEAGVDRRSLVVPDGLWIDWWQPETWLEAGSHTVDAPIERMPLYQRAGSVLALAHPDLMTVVPASELGVADPQRVGDGFEVLTSPGPQDRMVLRDGSVIEQFTEDGSSRVDVRMDRPRRVVIRVRSKDAIEARALVDGEAQDAVAGESIWSCDAPCFVEGAGELAVALVGSEMRLSF